MRKKTIGWRAACGAFVTAVVTAAAAQAGVVISTSLTKHMSCASGICSATANNAVMNVYDLASMLASGDVTIASGSVAQDIQVTAALTWTNTSRLTLDSYHAIAFDKPVVVAGIGALTITVNDGGSGGDFVFSGKGHVEFWDTSSSLVIGGMPYKLIRRADQLAKFARKNPAGFYALARDYTARKDNTYTRVFIPDLTGTIEGLGNKISNFTMNSKNAEVAFCSENHGTIRDLTLENIDIRATNWMVGGLVARNYGIIRNSAVSGQIAGETEGGYMGGLAAYNVGAISGSHVSASVNGSGGYVTGGLVGNNWIGGTITTSYATGAVIGGNGAFGGTAGGLVGENNNRIDQSYATGAVSGYGGGIGGLVGTSDGVGSGIGNLTNVYATGSVTGYAAGGLVGESGGNPFVIASAYSTGDVSGTGSLGGFAGQDSFTAIHLSYWDLDTSGISDPSQGAGDPQNDPGITGLTDTQLKSGLPAGFDPAIWGQSSTINNGYPYLLALPPG